MRFLADMGVAIRVVEWLRDQGYDAVHLREEGLQRMADDKIFRKAIAENRVLLTFDLDFGEIVAFSGREKAKVVLFRLQNTRASHVIDRLSVVLQEALLTTDKTCATNRILQSGRLLSSCCSSNSGPTFADMCTLSLPPLTQRHPVPIPRWRLRNPPL